MISEYNNKTTTSITPMTTNIPKGKGNRKKSSSATNPPITELEQQEELPVITFKNTKEKGDAYEIFIKHHLIDSGNYEWVYLWKDIPEAELFESGIMDDWNQARIRRKAGRKDGLLGDIGTDLLIKDKNGKFNIIQCKYYDNESSLRIKDLGTFYFMMMKYGNIINGHVYYTNKLSTLLNSHCNTSNTDKYTYMPFNAARYIELMNTIYKPIENINDSSNNKLIPYDYQIEAITKLTNKKRTVCQLPCGMGKTLIAIKLSEEYNQVIVITPLKIYCEQNMERFKSQMPSEYFMMIIDSDNDGRNIDNITKVINNNQKVCLFVTFKSVDIVNKLISDNVVSNYYVIIDEFHNLSISDILEDDLEDNLEEELLDEVNNEINNSDYENDNEEYSDEDIEEPENNQTEIYKLLHSDARILFMSATPKLMGSDNDYSEDCDIDEEIFGKIDYKMDMRTAIDRGGICDYMVYVPTLSIEKSTGLDKIQEEVDISKYDNELVIKARFIIRGMMNNGSRKCIVYLQTQEECRLMNTILEDISKNYFVIDVNSNYIISDSSREERKAIIDSFRNNNTSYNFICNINILNECIDIPDCDSIFIAYPSKSKIRNIQRMCRATRKNITNPNKIARIYIWADEYKDELVDFIGHLKEYDSQFTFDKVRRLNVIGNKTAVMKSSDVVEENKKLEDIVVGVRGISDWLEKLDDVKKFIDEHGRRPTNKDNKYLNSWICRQVRYYNCKLNYMNNNDILHEWRKFIDDDKYKIYFETDKLLKWDNMLKILKDFIDKNSKRPTPKTDKKIHSWMNHQIINRKKEQDAFKNKIIIKKWDSFVNDIKYIKYFENDIIKNWHKKLEKVKEFININKNIPSNESNSTLTRWIQVQNTNMRKKQHLMKYDFIYNTWCSFINDPKYNLNKNIYDEQLWEQHLEELKLFIVKNNKKPTLKTNLFLTKWLDNQMRLYKKGINIMKIKNISSKWVDFISDPLYSKYLLNNILEWKTNLNKVKQFIDKYNRRPSDKEDKKLTKWLSHQISNTSNRKQILKDDNIYELWNNFISDDKYKKYFNKNIIIDWNDKMDLLTQFLKTNKAKPTIITNKELYYWLQNQIANFKNKKKLMKNEEIRNIWENFISHDEYKKYFV
jgi:superfamily II DNA or RNA helicase